VPDQPRRWYKAVAEGWITAELFQEPEDGGILAINKDEFADWCKAEKREGRWPQPPG
jgi:hypothetical protein